MVHPACQSIAVAFLSLVTLSLSHREEPPNADEYAAVGFYLVAFVDRDSQSVAESEQRQKNRLGDSPHVVHLKVVKAKSELLTLALVRGSAGKKWVIEYLQVEPKMTCVFAEPLIRDLIEAWDSDLLDEFAHYLTDEE